MNNLTLGAALERPHEETVPAVRALNGHTTVVEAFDPDVTMGPPDGAGLDSVATDARRRLTAMLAALTEEN